MKAHRDAKWWSTAAALVAVVAATGSDGAGTPASGQTPTCKDGVIKVGAVSTITGPANFGEVPKAAKAVFDKVNAQGGISGCMVDYTIADDRGDPQVAAQVARALWG